MRDIGPTFVVSDGGEIAGVSWEFNAWGRKYRGFGDDAALAGLQLDRLGVRRFDAPFVLEGGAIHSDGEGTVLTTESVLLNPNRRMAGSRDAAEALLRDWIGAEKVIWLPAGLVEDETILYRIAKEVGRCRQEKLDRQHVWQDRQQGCQPAP